MLSVNPYVMKEIQKIPLDERSNVLDVGCGVGAYLEYLKGNITGIDYDQKNLEEAKKRFPKVQFIRHDCNHVPFPVKEKFDLILCFEVIEHLKRDESLKLMRELERISQGYIFLTTPNINNFTSFLRYVLFRSLEIAGKPNFVEKFFYFLKHKKLPPKENKFCVSHEDVNSKKVSNPELHYHYSNFNSSFFKK